MSAILIMFEGVEWPLSTFIDAYRYKRHDGEWPLIASTSAVLNYITKAGTLVERKPAHSVDFGNVLAYTLANPGSGAGYCDLCDAMVDIMELNQGGGFCQDCDEDHDPFDW
jgi:hypothetical protein